MKELAAHLWSTVLKLAVVGNDGVYHVGSSISYTYLASWVVVC